MTITCPECGYTFIDEGGATAATDEETSISDHGWCWACHRLWQYGLLAWQQEDVQ